MDPIIINSRLILRLETDVDDQGQSVIANRSISRVKPGADNQELKEAAEALASLQMLPLLGIVRVDENRLD